jgi:putative endonuclease
MKNERTAGMTWFLYLIECQDGSIYTGIAVDVPARYAMHEKGRGAKYTRSHPPRRLLRVCAYPDRASASRAEYAIKRLRKSAKRGFCLCRDGLWQLPVQMQLRAN